MLMLLLPLLLMMMIDSLSSTHIHRTDHRYRRKSLTPTTTFTPTSIPIHPTLIQRRHTTQRPPNPRLFNTPPKQTWCHTPRSPRRRSSTSTNTSRIPSLSNNNTSRRSIHPRTFIQRQRHARPILISRSRPTPNKRGQRGSRRRTRMVMTSYHTNRRS